MQPQPNDVLVRAKTDSAAEHPGEVRRALCHDVSKLVDRDRLLEACR